MPDRIQVNLVGDNGRLALAAANRATARASEAETYATEAWEARAGARDERLVTQAERLAAEEAADAAALAAQTAPNVYADTAAGLAAVSEGGSFWVRVDDELWLYRDVAGSAVYQDYKRVSLERSVLTVATAEAVKAIAGAVGGRVVRTLGHGAVGDGYARDFVFDAADTRIEVPGAIIRPDDVDPGDPGRFVAATRPRFTGVAPIANAVATSGGQAYAIAGQFNGKIWGILRSGSTGIYHSDDGVDWTAYCTTDMDGGGTDSVYKILACDDGEVLVQVGTTKIYRSTDFTADPDNVVWAKVFDLADHPELVGGIQPFNFDGTGHKFIVTHYSASWPGQNWERYGFISTDGGATWTIKYDSHAIHGSSGNHGHMHGVTYDPWADTFYIIEGHGISLGIYYSWDDGDTWHALTMDVTPSNAPTVIVPTDNGLVLGSDAEQQRGILFISRPKDRTAYTTMRVKFIHEIQSTALLTGMGDTDIIGFADCGYRDSRTGVVYMGWRNSYTQYPFLTASDGHASSTIYVEASAIGATANPGIERIVVNCDDEILFSVINPDGTTNKDVIASLKYGLDPQRTVDPGRLFGGNARGTLANQNSSVSVGPLSRVDGRQGVAIGQGAVAGASVSTISSVAIGYGVQATGNAAIAIGGTGTTANAASAINIGGGAMATQSNSVKIGSGGNIGLSAIAIGVGAGTTGFNHVNVGNGAAGQCCVGAAATGFTSFGLSAVSASGGVAIGASAVTSGNNATALGAAANAAHADSVALGQSSTTTAASQVKIGTRHMEYVELASDPAAGATNSARLYAKDNGSGKTQLCVRFATGAVQVLATEP